MAQETLKITITADNQQAVKNIQETVTATQKLGTAFKTLPSTSNQATTALSNLSRVAQDAPYGFIGIANNLNPLLESFQRLSKDAGGAGGALKAMAGGLMGPAGIGLALGAVSSILVAFGPKIADFINGTNEASKAEDKFAQSLKDARAEASETGIRLQAYLTITQNASVSDERRAEALKAVKTELGKVNSAYASTITNVDQARAAVDLYTQALVAQAITSRYIDEIANKTIALADANKLILQSGREYYKVLEMTSKMANSYSDASIVQAGSISKAKDANLDARNAALSLRSGIIGLNTELANTISLALNNPFFLLDKGAKQLASSTKDIADNIQRIGGQPRPLPADAAMPILGNKPTSPTLPNAPQTFTGNFNGVDAAQQALDVLELAKAQAKYNEQYKITTELTNLLAPAFDSLIQAMVMGEDIGLALQAAFKQIVIQLISMVAQALLFQAIMAAITGGVAPAAGVVTGGMGMGGGNFLGEFLLKGSDLVLATQRANNNLNIRRGN
jgi:hypothetical protein